MVQMPCMGVHLVDAAPGDLVHFVELRLQPAAENRTEVHDGHRSVRVLAGARFAEERADQSLDASANAKLGLLMASRMTLVRLAGRSNNPGKRGACSS